MQIKVNDTRMHQVSARPDPTNRVFMGAYKVPVAEGKLILINQYDWTRLYITTAGQKVCPVIISETERIVKGDWYLEVFMDKPQFSKATKTVDSTWAKKVLVLPEQFSPKHLQAIVDAKMKDGDKVLVECESFTNDTADCIGMDGTPNGVPFNGHTIKLNSQGHVTLHKIEEKQYTREEVKALFQEFLTYCSDSDANWWYESRFTEWFDQNFK